tara:strand:- start:314 stop:952 length:639 start_codon:yes stop_codon:yes gene_type:complete
MSQSDSDWSLILIDDISTDNTASIIKNISEENKKIEGIINTEKKYALRNIIETSRKFENNSDVIIAVIDGDDSICNDETVSILKNTYKPGIDSVWTGHRWDINGMNISKSLPPNIDPYQWPWCSSHLRTFRASLLKNIPDSNFKNTTGKWFKRGYDQALMLPVLKIAKNYKYVNEICYQYNINSVSISNRDWAERDQHMTVNLVRSRGFLSK